LADFNQPVDCSMAAVIGGWTAVQPGLSQPSPGRTPQARAPVSGKAREFADNEKSCRISKSVNILQQARDGFISSGFNQARVIEHPVNLLAAGD
jgi:hypothetical protein